MKKLLLFVCFFFNLVLNQYLVSATDTLSLNSVKLIAKIEKEYFDLMMNKQFINRLQSEVKKDRGAIKFLQENQKRILQQDSFIKRSLKIDVAALKSIEAGEPVILETDTLFFVYRFNGSFSKADKAKSISKNITQIGDNRYLYPDSIILVPKLNGSFSYEYLGETLFNLNLIDLAIINPENPDQAALFILVILRRKLIDYHNLNDFLVLSKKVGTSIAIIIGIILLLVFLSKVFRKLGAFATKKEERFSERIGIKKEQELLKKIFIESIHKGIALFRFTLFGFIIYLGLPILFNLFPQTKFITNTLLRWIIEPAYKIWVSTIAFLPNLMTILVIYIVTRYIIRMLKFFYNEVEKGRINIKGFHREFSKPTFQIIQFLIYAFMLVVIFPYLPGSESPAFKGVSVFIGVLFSLGSSSALSNIMAGLVLTYMRPFKIGDRVKIGECTGDVIEKTILVTKIKSIKNEEITLPNATVLNAQTLNYSKFAKTEGLIVHSTVTIGYDVPWEKMHAALIKAATKTKHIKPIPEPFVLQTSLDDFYVSYQINAYTNEPNKQISIYSELHQNIQDCCAQVGIEIMSPHYNAYRDGNQSTIPEIKG